MFALLCACLFPTVAAAGGRELNILVNDLDFLYGLEVDRIFFDGTEVFVSGEISPLVDVDWLDIGLSIHAEVEPGTEVTIEYALAGQDGDSYSFVDSSAVTFDMPDQNLEIGAGSPYLPETTFSLTVKGETYTRVIHTADELRDLFANGGSACLGGLLVMGEDLTVASGVSVSLCVRQNGGIEVGSHRIVNAGSLKLVCDSLGSEGICGSARKDGYIVYNTGRIRLDGVAFMSSYADYDVYNAGELSVGWASADVYLAPGSTTYVTEDIGNADSIDGAYYWGALCLTLADGADPVILPSDVFTEEPWDIDAVVWFERLDAQGEHTGGVVATGAGESDFLGIFGARHRDQAVRYVEGGDFELVPSIQMTVDQASLQAAHFEIWSLTADHYLLPTPSEWRDDPMVLSVPSGSVVRVDLELKSGYRYARSSQTTFVLPPVVAPLTIDADLQDLPFVVPVHEHGRVECVPVYDEASLCEALDGRQACYLLNDIAVTNDISLRAVKYLGNQVRNDVSHRICLNGKVLDLNGKRIDSEGNLSIEDCSCGVAHRFSPDGPDGCWRLDEAHGTMTVTGGVITAGRGIRSRRCLWMSGCNVVGCSGAEDDPVTSGRLGGGLYVGGTVTNALCSITGNVSIVGNAADCGGGIYVARDAPPLVLSGRVDVFGNTAGDVGDNLTLADGSVLGFAGGGIDAASRIGLTLLDATGTSVAGVVSTNAYAARSTCFWADDPRFALTYSDGVFSLVQALSDLVAVATGSCVQVDASSAERAVAKCAVAVASPEPSIIGDKAYAAYFKLLATPVPGVGGRYLVQPVLDESALGLETATGELASGLGEIASGRATALPVTGRPGLSYSVLYGTTPDSVTMQGQSVRCPSTGQVSIPIPTLSSRVMFYVLRIAE